VSVQEEDADDHGFADTHPALTAAEAAELEAMHAAQERQASATSFEKITLDEPRTETIGKATAPCKHQSRSQRPNQRSVPTPSKRARLTTSK
jgi:hypothetical protein